MIVFPMRMSLLGTLRFIANPGTAMFLALSSLANLARSDDRILDFEMVETGKPTIHWEEQGVRIELAHAPKKSKAVGRITFFPHVGTGRKGVVNAMANEAIPLRVRFESPAAKVNAKLWGSTTSAAYLEAFDKDGKSIGKKAIDQVPTRKSPEEYVPFFELSLDTPDIAYVEIGGAKPGGFVALDELRWTSNSDPK